MKARKSDEPRKSARKSISAPGKAAPVSVAKTKKSAGPPAAAAKEKRPPQTARLKVPPILLEGDAPATPAASGPGQRYSLGPTPPSAPSASTDAVLPEAYGTQQLFLTARDPRWLFACWDLNFLQIKQYKSLSVDKHLVLRVYRDSFTGEPLSQIHVHPESRDWFIPVPAAETKYLAELGYFDIKHLWVSVARSAATLTPPESLSDDISVRFATIPPEVPFEQLLAMVKDAVRQHIPLVEALQQMRAMGYKNLPAPEQVKSEEWTPAQEKALAEVISMDQVRRVWIGSLEITELIRRQLQQAASSIGASQFSLPSSLGALSSASSPFGGPERRRGFWFNINAELIIYGATEPDAKVTIGDRKIKLRPDGTFSFRFALPDGDYPLPAAAQSADGVETREARLEFRRKTRYNGHVGAHPQDKSLKRPLVSAVA